MKLKNIVVTTLFGLFCMAVGTFILGIIDAYYKKDMIHVHINNEKYDLDLFFKNRDILILNKQEEIERRVEGGMEDMLIDLMAPPPFQEVFSRINRQKLDEKYRFVEEFRKFWEERKKTYKDSKT